MKVQNRKWIKRFDTSNEAAKVPWGGMKTPSAIIGAMHEYGFPLLVDALSAVRVESGPWDHGPEPMDESWYEVIAQLEFAAREGRIIVRLSAKEPLLRDALDNMYPFAIYGEPSRVALPRERGEDDTFTIHLAERFMRLNADALTPRSGVEVKCARDNDNTERVVICGYSVADFGEGEFGRVWKKAGFSGPRWHGTVEQRRAVTV